MQFAEVVGEQRDVVAGLRAVGVARDADDVPGGEPLVDLAEAVVAAGMPVAALTPLELARWVGDQVQ